jgi:ABC-type nitrate/sulfonate/bicarbonate transport system substrate-binding protein
MIATNKGFYVAEGLEAETTYVGNVSATVQQLVGGSFDVGYSGCEPTLQAFEKGADISIIGAMSSTYLFSMMSAPNIRTASDLKGKTVVLPVPKQDISIFFDRWLHENGVKSEEVDKVYDGTSPNRYKALASGAVVAAVLGAPFNHRAAGEGYNSLIDFSTFVKNYVNVVILARNSWLKDNPDTARAYLRAVARAVDWFYDPANKDEAIDILARVSKLDRALVLTTYDDYQRIKPFRRGLTIPVSSVQVVANSMAELGLLKSAQSVMRCVNPNFLRG